MSALILHQEDGRSSFQSSLPPVIKCPNTSEIPSTSGQADRLSAAASRSPADGRAGLARQQLGAGASSRCRTLVEPPDPHPQDQAGSSGAGQGESCSVPPSAASPHIGSGCCTARCGARGGEGQAGGAGPPAPVSVRGVPLETCRKRCPTPLSMN